MWSIFLTHQQVSFPDRSDMKPVVLTEQPFSLQRYIGDCKAPNQCHTVKDVSIFNYHVPCFTLWTCLFYRETSMTSQFFMLLTLNFSDGCGCSSSSIECHVNFQVSCNRTLLYLFFFLIKLHRVE